MTMMMTQILQCSSLIESFKDQLTGCDMATSSAKIKIKRAINNITGIQ
jgi:hypothetical protein